MEELDAFFAEKLNIRLFDEVTWLDAELSHDFMRFDNARFQWLVL